MKPINTWRHAGCLTVTQETDSVEKHAIASGKISERAQAECSACDEAQREAEQAQYVENAIPAAVSHTCAALMRLVCFN